MDDTMELTIYLLDERIKRLIRALMQLKEIVLWLRMPGKYIEIPYGPPPGDPRPVMMTQDEARHIHEVLHHSIWEDPNPQPAVFLELLRAMQTVAEDNLEWIDGEIEALESELDVGKEQE